MNIRRATKSDVDIVFEMTKQLAIYEKEIDNFTANKQFFLEHVLCDKPKHECYLIENDQNNIVGMGSVCLMLGTYTASFKLNLLDFYVQEEHRGKGYGIGFFKFLAQEAKTRNCSVIFWGVYDWNELARKLYEKVGKPHNDTLLYSMDLEKIEALL